MLQRIWVITTMILLISSILLGCESESAGQNSQQDADPSKFLGTWVYPANSLVSPGDLYVLELFEDNEAFLIGREDEGFSFRGYFDYEVISDNSLILTDKTDPDDPDYNEETTMRLSENNQFEVTFFEEQILMTRLTNQSSLQEKIVGLWVDDDGEFVEIIGSYSPPYLTAPAVIVNNAAFPYFLTDNSVMVFGDGSSIEAITYILINDLSDDSAMWIFPDIPDGAFPVKRVKGHPNLSSAIVGTWKDENGDTWEFTERGEYAFNTGPKMEYQIFSDSTLLVEHNFNLAVFWHVLDLSMDTLEITPNDEDDFEMEKGTTLLLSRIR